jgi:hypothetical protein
MNASKKITNVAPKRDIVPNHGHLKVRVMRYSMVGKPTPILYVLSGTGSLREAGEDDRRQHRLFVEEPSGRKGLLGVWLIKGSPAGYKYLVVEVLGDLSGGKLTYVPGPSLPHEFTDITKRDPHFWSSPFLS